MDKVIEMDKIIDKIIALGVQGLVLLVAIHVAGFARAAALTTRLAVLGSLRSPFPPPFPPPPPPPFPFPLGMIWYWYLLALIAKGISDYGFEKIYRGVIDRMKAQGKTKGAILRQIDGYLISGSLKAKLKSYIRDHWD